MPKSHILVLTVELLVIQCCFCGDVEKIEWNVVKLGGKDRCNVNLIVAVDSLGAGKMVGLPTDTVYSFIADATRIRPIGRLYNSTGPAYRDLPITVVVEDLNMVCMYADIDHLDRSMVSQLLPGRVTAIFPRRPGTLPYVNPDYEFIPIRLPAPKSFLKKVLQSFGKPVGMVGARKVGRTHSRVIEDFEDIRLRAYVVYDSGKLEMKKMVGSTIVDLTHHGRYKILSPGCVQDTVTSILERYEVEEWADAPNITIFNPT